MKTKIAFIFFTAIIAFLLFSLSDLFSAQKTSNVRIFAGRVIYIGDDYFELKKGKNDSAFYITENTKFIAKNGKEAEKEIIFICQYVKAFYSQEKNKNVLNKIIVTKESDCVK